ncbi:hypothetical protein [uncultured Dysosmobacter sp.]|uniref:hypothetical protein n=1 Tax=uncultured Dysosmobacter sp. TaxID=2591384 RepID=UPI0026361929|nr:hypothetical protein [uncultured Dysosmobacter sp.]
MSWRERLRERAGEIGQKRLTVGFDGFADTIVRPLRQAPAPNIPPQPFETIREFGEYLAAKAEKSCSVELRSQGRQLGGNLPFLSRAAGQMGLDVSCIGMLGDPGAPDPLFASMPCKLYPFAPPGQSTCMEFNDGKVLLSADCELPGDPWEIVLQATDGQAPGLFQDADLIALLNWSELSFAHRLWEKVLEVVRAASPDKTRFAFFDLCDVSRRSAGELDAVLRLIGAFSTLRTGILSLNENEALAAARQLLSPDITDPAAIASALRDTYAVDEVIVHTIRDTALVTPRGTVRLPTDFVAHPRISTGAGDHFNAASCFAAVMDFPDLERVEFANTFAHFYVSEGRTPQLSEL